MNRDGWEILLARFGVVSRSVFFCLRLEEILSMKCMLAVDDLMTDTSRVQQLVISNTPSTTIFGGTPRPHIPAERMAEVAAERQLLQRGRPHNSGVRLVES